MQNKLQELTDKLYNEGLSKGKQEADEIIGQARRESEEIIAAAEAKARQIVSQAEKDAAEMQTRVNGDLRMAAEQAISATKQYIEGIITAECIDGNVAKALSDTSFIKEILTTVVKAFDADKAEATPLEAILPAKMKEDLEKALSAEVISRMSSGLEISYAKGLSHGFRIGPRDGGFKVGFTADDFSGMIAAYLRPATRKILFGE